MTIGGLGAYWVFNNGEKLINLKIFIKPFQWFFISLLVIYLCFQGNIHNQVWDFIFSNGYFSYFVVNILFMYLILTVSVIPQKIIVLGNPILSYLGEISYGIYMYHMLIIFTTMFLFKDILLKVGQVEGYLLYYSFIVGGTIALASISKKYFEDRFLKMRKKILKQGS
jgi:peptidoglycan/LPS O-acetylase OafA/YrhL